jgi:secreted trypsin-like serine protease
VLSDSGRLLDPPTWAYIGLNNWQKDSPRQYERIRVKKIEWHPLYRRSSLTYDAAVLVLDQKAKAKPVALAPAKQRLWVGTSLLTAGFGATDRAPVSPQLM